MILLQYFINLEGLFPEVLTDRIHGLSGQLLGLGFIAEPVP